MFENGQIAETYGSVTTAQGKQGIWLSIYADRENTGNLRNLIKKHREFGQERENESFLGLSYSSTGGGCYLQINIIFCMPNTQGQHCKHGEKTGEMQGISP